MSEDPQEQQLMANIQAAEKALQDNVLRVRTIDDVLFVAAPDLLVFAARMCAMQHAINHAAVALDSTRAEGCELVEASMVTLVENLSSAIAMRHGFVDTSEVPDSVPTDWMT